MKKRLLLIVIMIAGVFVSLQGQSTKVFRQSIDVRGTATVESGITIESGDLDVGTGSISVTGGIAETGSRVSAAFMESLTLTNPLYGNVRYDSITFEVGDVVEGVALADSSGTAVGSYATGSDFAKYDGREWSLYNAMGTTLITDNSFINPSATTAISDAYAYYLAVYIPYDCTITGLRFLMAVQGDYTADQTNQVGLYSVSGSTLTKIAASANNGNLWKATDDAMFNVAFSAPVAVTAGLYYAAFVFNYSAYATLPSLLGRDISYAYFQDKLFANGHKISSRVSGQTALPDTESTGDMAVYAVVYWVGLY